VLNPVARAVNLNFGLSKRIPSLKNLTLGLVWNRKGGGDIALKRVSENLKRELGYNFNILQFDDEFPFGLDTIEKVAASCQAVIGSTGD
jgi:hypothetical protein